MNRKDTNGKTVYEVKASKLTVEEARERITPEFSAAMHEYIEACEKYGEESASAKHCWAKAIVLAPPAFIRDICEMAKEEKLLPDTDVYLQDGTPVISSRTLAEHLNVSHEEVLNSMEELAAIKREYGISTDDMKHDASEVFRKQ